MSHPKTKLELTWIGKDQRPRLEPRILLEDPSLSYHAAHRVSDTDLFDSRVIFGDNLLALKALEQEFTGKIKCIYIDPPFNTKGAFKYYDDNLEHSIWLSMMRERLLLLHRLLSNDGALVVNLDDSECAYCKAMLDEIFGRNNYILTIVVEAATPSSFKTVNTGPTEVVQYLLFYAKDKARFKYQPQYQPIYTIDLQHFSRFVVNIEDPADAWTFQSINDYVLSMMGFDGETTNNKWSQAKKLLGAEEAKELVRQRATEFALENCDRVFETKTLQKPSKWLHDHLSRSLTTDYVIELKREGLESLYIYKGRQVYFLGKGVREVDGERVVTQPLSNLWTDIPTNNLQDEGGVDFPAGKKPESLIARVIGMISDSHEDWVLDSFAGSGTTGAVAHKMGRRFIMVELGDHIHTHILPRLHKVVDGTDSGGISQAVGWKGGGGFRYYKLAPSLLQKDTWGNWVINKDYNPAMLAEAMCKHEGFTYAPSEIDYWNHGYSSETDFLYVTTQTLTQEQLSYLSEQVGDERTLLICCLAWRGSGEAFPNLTLKKIPNAVKNQCEWGRDDYSLQIASLPAAPKEEAPPAPNERATRRKTSVGGQEPALALFEEEEGAQ